VRRDGGTHWGVGWEEWVVRAEADDQGEAKLAGAETFRGWEE
jgi:hypothetical protein